MDDHKNFPTRIQKFIIRDILQYSDEEIKMLSLSDYQLALYYASETYVRRDILFIMNKIYGKKGSDSKDNIKLKIEHPEIEEWIQEQYEEKNERPE